MSDEKKESSKKTAAKVTKKVPAKKKPATKAKAKPAAKKATAAKTAKKTTKSTTKTAAKSTSKTAAKTAAKPTRKTSPAKSKPKAKSTRATVKPKPTTASGTKKAAPKKTATKPKASAASNKTTVAKKTSSTAKDKTKTTKTAKKPTTAKKTAASKKTTATNTRNKPTAKKEISNTAPEISNKENKSTPTAKKASTRASVVPKKSTPAPTANKEKEPTSTEIKPQAQPEPTNQKTNKPTNQQTRKPNNQRPKQPKNQRQNQQNKTTTNKDTKGEDKTQSVKLLINADEPEECRVALLENGKLESFHIETVAKEQNKGNIYKCKVVSVEKNLQAAFVDFGTGKNGFLPFSEIHPEYYSKGTSQTSHWKSLNIREAVKEGQEMLVEVVKETTGNKGASLTTFLSLPGRYVVLMPGSDSHGISRQIDSREQRAKLREMLADCNIPEGVGYIIRTAAKGITKTALTKDVKFQINLWKEIKKRGQNQPTPSLVFKEQDIIDRFLRDHFSPEIQEILTDNQEAFKQVNNFLDLLPATQRKKTSAKLHKGPRPLLNSYNIEEQIEQIYRPTVKLPSGGSIVINPTEALVAIDVNSGSTGGRDKNFEETIFMANMEAAEELTRQLRLRDLGGLVVVDFIDMRSMAHTKEVERKVKAGMKRDKAKVDFSRISKFGLMQISRQRMGAPVQAGNYITCAHCQGRGVVRSVENQALTHLRQIQTGVTRKHVKTVHCTLPMEVSQYLLNKKRADLADMERRYRVSIVVEGDAGLNPAQAKIEFLKK